MKFKGLFEDREEHDEWYLRVDYHNNNGIDFVAVDRAGGVISRLFYLNAETGKIDRVANIPKQLGLELGITGQIQTT